MRTVRRSIASVILATLCWATPVHAAGYDTPILYTARHMGMGGTAIASVRDGSAPFHNPAGLGNIGAGNLIVDVSLLTGHLVASPAPLGQSEYASETKSNPTIAPFFLVGGAVRITDWMTAGLAVYPVASAGGVYEYNLVSPTINQSGDAPVPGFTDVQSIYDETKIVFFELAPSLAFNLPGNLRLGFSYRLSMIQMDRFQGSPDNIGGALSFELSGFNFAGYKIGLQWAPIEELEVGFVYRSSTETVIEGTDAFFFVDHDNARTSFMHPDKFGLGVRGTLSPVSFALDLEYTFNSKVQSQLFEFYSDEGGSTVDLNNFARWQDNLTLRFGAEYCIDLESVGLTDHHIKPRVGYVYDGQVGSKSYPTAFGTPPTATQTITAGLGYKGGPWEVSLAYAFRYGAVTVDSTDLPSSLDENTDSCLACSKAGFYEIALHGIYADFSWDF